MCFARHGSPRLPSRLACKPFDHETGGRAKPRLQALASPFSVTGPSEVTVTSAAEAKAEPQPGASREKNMARIGGGGELLRSLLSQLYHSAQWAALRPRGPAASYRYIPIRRGGQARRLQSPAGLVARKDGERLCKVARCEPARRWLPGRGVSALRVPMRVQSLTRSKFGCLHHDSTRQARQVLFSKMIVLYGALG